MYVCMYADGRPITVSVREVSHAHLPNTHLSTCKSPTKGSVGDLRRQERTAGNWVFKRSDRRTDRSVRLVGPTGRSDWSVRLVCPTGRSDDRIV